MHITRGGPRNQGAGVHGRAASGGHGEPGGRPVCEVLCPHGSAYAHYPCFITFSCHFFYPKKYFLKVEKKKKKDISNMQILESSRPIRNVNTLSPTHSQAAAGTAPEPPRPRAQPARRNQHRVHGLCALPALAAARDSLWASLLFSVCFCWRIGQTFVIISF